MELIGVLIILGLVIGSVLGWVSFLRISELRRQIKLVQKELRFIRERIEDSSQAPASVTTPIPDSDSAPEAETSSAEIESVQARWAEATLKIAEPAEESENTWQGPTAHELEPQSQQQESKPESSSAEAIWLDHLREQWMAWLGGLCVGLAGIFMVRYSIEQGYIGPTGRIAMALITGVLLHGVAEWARRRSIGNYQALAALAGGASITLFAALLAALHLYQLLSPLVVFALLAIVSLLTMALAVLHGPVLAIIGILGAYIVPVLVNTGSESIAGVLIYSLVISAAAMALMQFVYRYWIWAGMLIGALSWWFLSLLTIDADGIRGYYLAALSYLVIAVPMRDWVLSKADWLGENKDKISNWRSSDDVANAPVRNSMLLILIAYGFSIFAYASAEAAIFYWTPQIVLLFLASRHRISLTWLPWISLGLQCAAWIGVGLGTSSDGIQIVGLRGADQTGFLAYAGWIAAVYFAMALWNLGTHQRAGTWISLALVSPLLWLALCYLLISGFAESWVWGSTAVAIGVAYFILASWRLKQESSTEITVWLILAGHFAYSLAAAILLKEAGLTLALSAQLFSLAWVIKRYELVNLSLLLKLVLAVVVIRLTTNPWLLTYPSDIHWSLWSYGGATVFCTLAAMQLRATDELRKWLEVAIIHLLVLTLWAETRYWLYDGEIFRPRFELLEAAINTALWSSLALVYYLRSRASINLKTIYVWVSRILLLLAIAGYALVLLIMNPLWSTEEVSTRPLLNILLLAYGFPVIISMLIFRYYDSQFKRAAAAITGISAFVFISMEIRHLWQRQLDLDLPTSNGELYTYSIVWLVMAVLTMLAGGARYGIQLYHAGLALLFVVIGKLFLVDMADLEGLLRVASFMGLGLSLLGLAYLYQRFNFKHRA